MSALIEKMTKNVKYSTNRGFRRCLIWVAGIAYCIDMAENSYFKHSFFYSFTSWPYFWMMVILGGIFAGAFIYAMRGVVYHIGVKLSGGPVSFDETRRVILYAGVPLYATTIIIEIVNMLVYGSSYYLDRHTYKFLDIVFTIVPLLSFAIFVFLIYKFSRHVCFTKPVRTTIFIVLVPVLFNVYRFVSSMAMTAQDWRNLF